MTILIIIYDYWYSHCIPVILCSTHLEEVKHSREGRSLQERRLGELEDVWEAGASHGSQAAALQAGDGREQVESELRDVEVGLG